MKTIFYPGNSGQTCQAQYAVATRRTDVPAISRTEVLFVEGGSANPGGTFCNFRGVPAHLVNKILSSDLAGCRIDLIDFFYAGPPDELGRRYVQRWECIPDLIDFAQRGGRCQRSYANGFDAIKAKFGMRVTPIRVETNSIRLVGGSCKVEVNEFGPTLDEDERTAMLQRFGVLSR